MLKTTLIAFGALSIPVTLFVLALCRAAARGDRMTDAALSRIGGRGEVGEPEPQHQPKKAAA